MKNRKDPLEFFKHKCREHNLRITPQRIAIYEALQNDESHPCADDIYRKIKPDFPHISFDTVNRTLMSFAEIGVIKITESYNKQKRFDPDTESHHHLSCVKCGRIIDFENKEFDGLEVPSSIKNKYKVIGKRVVLECICDNCVNKKNERG